MFVFSVASFGQLQYDEFKELENNAHETYIELNSKQQKHESFFTGIYDIAEVKMLLDDSNQDLSALQKIVKQSEQQTDQTTELIESIKHNLETVDIIKRSFMDYQQNQELLSNDYFDLWNQVFKKKVYVDRLYTKVNVTSTAYAGQNEQEFQEIRRKGIYYPCQMLYDHYLLQIRNANQCDYTGRIEILNQAQQLLYKMEEMAKLDKTRDIEKEMKKLTSPEEVQQYLSKQSF